MAVAWSKTHRPYLTESGWVYYDQLYRSNAILGIQDPDSLRAFYPKLINNGKQDFPHFWFYSLGAAVIAELGDYSGIRIPIHNAFLIWHCALLGLLLVIAIYMYSWHGLLAALLLTFLSPAFWYIDKVHTEFFTFTLTTSAVILFTHRKYLASALLLGLVATQNISFSLISLLVMGFALSSKRGTRWRAGEITLLLASLLVSALHPAYYLLRYGTISPQFVSGGAQAAINLSRFYVWLLDPDIGLLPNWWFGCLVLVFALLIAFQRKWRLKELLPWLLFTLFYLAVSLLAQSSTTNLNSGASPGPSRYALWYIALFFPILLLSLQSAGKTHLSALAFTLIVLLAGNTSVRGYLPSLVGVAHCQPSAPSYWIQKHLPWLYNPPPEVFAERYGGMCEPILSRKNTAVIAPDCRKVLLLNLHGNSPFTITGASGCNLDFQLVSELLAAKVTAGQWTDDKPFHTLTREEIAETHFTPQLNVDYPFSFGGTLTQGIGSEYLSWGLYEDWGVWTVGDNASLTLPCPGDKLLFTVLELDIRPFITEAHPQVSTAIQVDEALSWSGVLEEPRTIRLAVPSGTCAEEDKMTMRIEIADSISRADLGISGDKRKLGLGLLNLRYLDQ